MKEMLFETGSDRWTTKVRSGLMFCDEISNFYMFLYLSFSGPNTAPLVPTGPVSGVSPSKVEGAKVLHSVFGNMSLLSSRLVSELGLPENHLCDK